MLPQPLVQNKLISNPKNTSFKLDWSLATPIINLNFFHIDKLTKESIKYRQLLKPWTPTTIGASGVWDNVPLHAYFYSQVSVLDRQPLQVYPGTLVGRINHTDGNPTSDFMAITPPYIRYHIPDATPGTSQSFGAIYEMDYPALVRLPVAGLREKQQISLLQTNDTFKKQGRKWIWETYSINNWDSGVKFGTIYTKIRRATDFIFGRIVYQSNCLANILIHIEKQWNPNNKKFLFTLSFADQNFPSDATVELY